MDLGHNEGSKERYVTEVGSRVERKNKLTIEEACLLSFPLGQFELLRVRCEP